MSNTIIQQKILSKIRQEYDTFLHANSQIAHKPLKGTFNEYGIVSLLAELLPKNYGLGKGLIIDTKNSQSCESDVIIYDKNDIAPAFFGPDTGLFPIECCRYVFEIKSCSNATEIKDAIEKARILKSMHSVNGNGPVFSYFAYTTDIIDMTEFERYFKYDNTIATNALIDVICVIKNGYWYKRNSVMNGQHLNTAWLGITSNNQFEEVLCFISGILNTLNRITQLGYYLLENKHMPFSYINFFKLGLEIKPENIELYNEYCIASEKNQYDIEIQKLSALITNKELLRNVLATFSIEDTDPIRKSLYNSYKDSL
jgi:hypothetical protein